MNKDSINALGLVYKKHAILYLFLGYLISISTFSLGQKQKILFAVNAFPWYTDTGFMHQLTAAKKNGFDVALYTASTQKSSHINPTISQYDLLKKIYSVDIPDDLSSYRVIVCQSTALAHKFIDLKKKMELKTSVVSHISSSDLFFNSAKKTTLDSNLFMNGDLFICDSDYLKYQLELKGCETAKIVVLPMPVDTKKFPFRIHLFDQNNVLHIISVGPLNKCRSYRDIIQVLKERIVNKNPNFRLLYTIVGDGPSINDIKKAISDYQMENYVDLVGWCSDDELVDRLSRAHIFIHPACTTSDGVQEGVPDCLKEAMAIGTVIITTRHGGIQELIEDNATGLLFPEHDTIQLGACINSLIRHPERWPYLQLNARKFVENYYGVKSFELSFKKLLKSLC